MLLSALLVLGGLALPAPAAPPAPGDFVRIWEVARTSNRPQRLVMDLGMVVRGEYATLMIVGREAVRPPGGALTRTMYAEFGTGAPRWYSTDYPVPHSPPCLDTLLCEDPTPEGYAALLHLDTQQTDGHPVARTYYVATAQSGHALEATLTVSAGWRAREITTGFRIVRADSAVRTTGVRYGSQAVEIYHGASAPGGRYGSVAYALVPCNPRNGVGSATLFGGTPVYGDRGVMTCVDPPNPTTVGETTSRTTWEVRGEVVGETAPNNRLVVFDFPKP